MTHPTKEIKKIKKIAIIGAGPIGIEAALRATTLGYDVTVFERHNVGAHLTRWGHVTFFSPWPLNTTQLGLSTLSKEFPADQYPTARQYLDQYLIPLSQSPPLHNKIQENTNVLGVSRKFASKGDLIGKPERATQPFVLLIEKNGHQQYTEADIVIDATGTYADPNFLGAGGLPLPGERALNEKIERHIPDILDKSRDQYANKRVLVIGEGFSAATTLEMLHELKQHERATQIAWLFRSPETPFEVIPNDPLPQRERLTTFANLASQAKIDGITPLGNSSITQITPLEENSFQIEILRNGYPQSFVVDKIISNVGYKPDTDLYRELQIHLCYASEGPMKLAASLLASSSAGSTDCLQQTSAGADVLRSPEANFFILGTKSYGRGSSFLLKIGFEQIDDLFRDILSYSMKQ